MLGRLLPVEITIGQGDPRLVDRGRITAELVRLGGCRLGRPARWFRRVVWFTTPSARDAALDAVRSDYGWTAVTPAWAAPLG